MGKILWPILYFMPEEREITIEHEQGLNPGPIAPQIRALTTRPWQGCYVLELTLLLRYELALKKCSTVRPV